jgi:hypothetical protein
MTAEEWFSAPDPGPLLLGLAAKTRSERQSNVHARRLRLFACAVARQVWDLLSTDARSAVQASERFAEGHASLTDLMATALRKRTKQITSPSQLALAAAKAASGVPPNTHHLRQPNQPTFNPIDAALNAARAVATRAVGAAPLGRSAPIEWHTAWTKAFIAARMRQTNYFRDIFPPPRYRAKRHPQWITSTVLALTQQMDESGDFSAIPILADALQDAGCDDEMLLSCCRSPGNVHVRGNWVVSLILERD